jgi:hypothetical protein
VRRPSSFRKAFVGYHWVLAAGVAGVYAAIVYCTHHTLLGHLDKPTRTSFYLSLAATSGVLLGFSLTAVAIFLTLGDGRGLSLLREQPEYEYVRIVLMGAIYAFGITTSAMTALILLDAHVEPRLYLEVIAIGIASLAFFRTWSVLWLLNRLLRLAIKPESAA